MLPKTAEANPTEAVDGAGPSVMPACMGAVAPTAATTLAAITAAVPPLRIFFVNVATLPSDVETLCRSAASTVPAHDGTLLAVS